MKTQPTLYLFSYKWLFSQNFNPDLSLLIPFFTILVLNIVIPLLFFFFLPTQHTFPLLVKASHLASPSFHVVLWGTAHDNTLTP